MTLILSNIKSRDMKNLKITSFFLAFVAVLFLGNVANAQFDDLYYDASDEVSSIDAESYDSYDSAEYDDTEYDNAEYTAYDWEEDEYIYTKRINRFYRPSRSLGYYGSYYNSGFGYSDFGYYNNAGIYGRNALLIASSPYSTFAGSRLGYNRFSPFYSPYGRNSFVGASPFGRTFGSPFGGAFGGAAFGTGGAYYCPPSYNFNSNRNAVVGNVRNSVSGRNVITSSRNSGTTSRSISNNPRSNRASATSTTARNRTNANTSTRRSSPRTSSARTNSSRSSSARSATRSSRSYAPSTRSNRSTRSYNPSSSSRSSRSIRTSSPSRSSSSIRTSSRSSSRSSNR